jgi:LacI family transcriptional regulator
VSPRAAAAVDEGDERDGTGPQDGDPCPQILGRRCCARSGVSSATVSYVLNGRPGVSDDMRERVLAAAERLGYPLEKHQLALQSPPTRVIGLVLADVGNPF